MSHFPSHFLLLLLMTCIQNTQIAHAFTSVNKNPPPLKGSTFKANTALSVSNPETESTPKQQTFPAQFKKTKAKYTSKKRQQLKIFNRKLTECSTATELLSTFMEQTSKKSQHEDEVATAATHLAGAKKINSVNYATCLHRLARFASNSYGSSGEGDEWKMTLSDPRFALLLCSVAEMGARVDASISVQEGKRVVEKWETDVLMNVDEGMKFADDVLSDILGVSLGSDESNGNDDKSTQSGGTSEIERRRELAETSMAQLLTPNKRSSFSSRECSNICWALAKIRVAPPSKALPVGRIADTHHEQQSGNSLDEERQFVSLDEMSLDVLSSCLKIRNQLFEEARRRKSGATTGGGGWIPELSRLAGKLMDLFAVQIIQEYASRKNGEENSKRKVFNPQEMASALWAFAKARRSDDVLFAAVAEELLRQTMSVKDDDDGKKPKPQEFANTLWAFATAGIRVDAHIKLSKLMADAMDEGNGEFFGGYFKPQELANSAWALATLYSKRTNGETNKQDSNKEMEATEDDAIVRILRWVARNIQQQVENFKPQELSNSVWAFATLGFGYDEAIRLNLHNDYTYVKSDAPAEDKSLVFDTLEIVAENALPRLDKFKAQELNNLAWAYARLGHRTERADKLFQGIADQLGMRVHQFKPQDVGTTLWSLATVECPDPKAFRAGASRLNFQHIRSFKPQEMSNAVWALATAGFAPEYQHVFDTTLVPANLRPSMSDIKKDVITECYAAVAGELMRRTDQFKDQELKDVLWAFSKIGIRHPSLFKKVAENIVGPKGRGFSTFSPQGIGNTIWSYARQAQISNDVVGSFGLEKVNIGTTGRLAMYETSCLDIGEDLIKSLYFSAAEASMAMGLDRFTSQDLSNTCWAYSTLGLLHSRFFSSVEQQVMARLHNRLCGQEVSNILWSFATLNAQPDPAMIDLLSSHIKRMCSGKNGSPDESSIARAFKRHELTNIIWSCAVLGRYPKEMMKILYQGILGTENNPQLMKQIHGDDGLQKSSLMTMYYVQYAVDVEAPELRLSLPKGFPTGWLLSDSSASNSNTDDDQTSSSMLQLTISKLQKEVSETLTRIGFENMLEYIIDAPTNQNDCSNDEESGVFSDIPDEFLSIDIANVEKRIGVEVDGPAHFVRLIDKGEGLNPNSVHGQFADRGENRVNGPTLLKHRLLTALGWNIIHIPYWEYQSLTDEEQKEDYCRGILDEYSSSWSS